MPSRSDQQAVAPDDSHETIARLEVALDSATAELDALRRSRTFRYTARLRAGYARARGLVRQTDGAAAKTGDVAAPSGVGLPERRQALARRFLRGEGIEIGPLHQPLRLDPGLRVRYVDRMTVDALRSHYAELAGRPLAVSSSAAYAIFDGLFQQALLRHLAGYSDAGWQLEKSVESIIDHLIVQAEVGEPITS